MKINVVVGDLFILAMRGDFDAIAHGCNCFHVMGSGVAPLMNQFVGDNKLMEADKKTSYGDINKMGGISFASKRVDVIEPPSTKEIHVFNLYTQHTYGNTRRGGVDVHWDSVIESLVKTVYKMNIFGCLKPHVGIPLIGCGLAGGSIDDFVSSLKAITLNFDLDAELTIVVLGNNIAHSLRCLLNQ
jgi:O-acetyl-ADP-ribose deacetylase (regulator of RNase III)